MMLRSILREIIKKFFEPLIKHPFLTIGASIIIGIVLYICADIVAAEMIYQTSYDTHILATEMIIELGPGLTEESKTHAEMIKLYTRHLEQRQLARIVRVLYPQYSLKKTLVTVLSDLEQAALGNNEEKAEKAIRQAGLASNQLYMLSKRFPRSPYKWFKTEKLPSWLKADLQQALSKSTKMVNKLEEEKAVKSAIESCRANRKAILLLFLARLSYDNEEAIKSFKREVERARDCTLLLAKENSKDKEKQKWLTDVAKSEDRRVKILGAMLDNDMDKVCKLLTKAIEEAFEKEKSNAAV